MNDNITERIVTILENKKAQNISNIDVKDKTIIADNFVVATGTSITHIRALADNVEEELKKQNIYPNKIEGYNSNGWILLDYGEVVVHIFTEQERERYNLDELWKISK